MATTIQHAKPTQHAEPITEENLYTILGFQGREDFENKINKFVNKEIWQLFVQCFEKEIGYAANKEVAKNIVCAIAKSHRGNAFTKTERIILNEKQGSKKREKAIGKAIDILKEMYSTKALEELSIIKRQAEGFLKTDFYQAQNKQLQGFAPSGAQLFADTLEYIQSLEKSARVEKKELIKNFLLNHVKPLNKKSPHLQSQIEGAISILSDDELRERHDEYVQNGVFLSPPTSYEKCKAVFDKMDQMKSKFESVMKKYNEQLKSTLDGDTKPSHEQVIDNLIRLCIDLSQNLSEDITVFIEVRTFQEKINSLLSVIKEDIRNSSDVKEFREIIDNLHKEHDTQKINKKIELALKKLAQIKNRASKPKLLPKPSKKKVEAALKNLAQIKNPDLLKRANKPALLPKPSKEKIEEALKNLAQIKNPDLLKRANKPALLPKPSKEKIEEALKNLAQIKNPDPLKRDNKPVLLPKPSKEKIEEAHKKLAQIENQENKTRELNKDLKKIDRLIKFCVSLSQNPSHKQGASKDTAFSTAITVFSKAINYHFSSTTKETKNLPDMKKFHGIMDNLHKEHDPQQINKEIGLALTCLANTQNEIYAQLGKFSDTPTTELKDPLQQANSVTKVTRL